MTEYSSSEECWQHFWAPICTHDGKIDIDLIKTELYDYQAILHEVALVYDHVTNGHISKPNTPAAAVIGEFDAFVERLSPLSGARSRILASLSSPKSFQSVRRLNQRSA